MRRFTEDELRRLKEETDLAQLVRAAGVDLKPVGQVIDFYHRTLKETTEAAEYLAFRGLSSGEMVDRFKLGYANRTLGYRLPERDRKAGGELRGRLVKLGIYRATGHEHFS